MVLRMPGTSCSAWSTIALPMGRARERRGTDEDPFALIGSGPDERDAATER
jgi:hypothetical protein